MKWVPERRFHGGFNRLKTIFLGHAVQDLLDDRDKPHGCDLCHKKFALACNLRAHMKTHEGEQLEECPNCNKTYIGGEGRLCSHCHPSSALEPPEHPESEESVTSD